MIVTFYGVTRVYSLTVAVVDPGNKKGVLSRGNSS